MFQKNKIIVIINDKYKLQANSFSSGMSMKLALSIAIHIPG